MSPPKPIYAYVSAAALAIVTIFTFYVFRDFGPQSVIRRFHIDVESNDQEDLNQVLVQNGDPVATRTMLGFVSEMAQSHATFQIQEIKRLHKEVLATVEYRLPNGKGVAVIWHVVQNPGDWRVDCGATWAGILRAREGTS